MTDRIAGGPAYSTDEGGHEGMSLRDYYAWQGLPEALRDFQNANRRFPETNEEREAIALRVYAMSDAMLKVRGCDAFACHDRLH